METRRFETETHRILDLVINSLYASREIFLRELIANASDALDRLRLESLTQRELWDGMEPLQIRLTVDPAARTLTIRDNGIGMSRDEVVAHLGTIARSGTQELIARLQQDGPATPLDLIGRFGVGFYSAFMVADVVRVVTRRANAPSAIVWESHGGPEYQIDETDDAPRGTSVTLHLKQVEGTDGADYTARWILQDLVKRYADFVAYPIIFSEPTTDAEPTTQASELILNSMKPVWTRKETEVSSDEYLEFYRHVSGDWAEPLLRMSFKAEGRWEYSSLLFVPSEASYELHYQSAPFGLQLYSHRMLVVQNCQDVLPRYLRFVKGVVDTGDLPLNVSRHSLQDVQYLAQIRRWLTRKVVDALGTLRTSEPDRFRTLWNTFGRVLKEGVSEDRDSQAQLLSMALFASSAHPTELTTLADYVQRMKADQHDILYLTGETRAVIERSPHLEVFRANGQEVLYLSDPTDELLVSAASDFDGHRLRSVANGDVAVGELFAAERDTAEQTAAMSSFLGFLQRALILHVRSVRVSRRLTTSPACLAGDEYDSSPRLDRLLLRGKGAGPRPKRILELNARHPLVRHLNTRFIKDPGDTVVAASANLLLGYAALAEGSELPDPVVFTESLASILEKTADQPVEGLSAMT